MLTTLSTIPFTDWKPAIPSAVKYALLSTMSGKAWTVTTISRAIPARTIERSVRKSKRAKAAAA
ncbi:MAG: hypothetical protein Q8K00_02305 [Syntrophales bacterium]|nr:hypothetical protein [Syntrophales bacterium]